jgi:AAA+ superfamily predicted ATPase
MSVTALPLSNRGDGRQVAVALDGLHRRLSEIVGCTPPEPADPEDVPAPLILELERRLGLTEPERQAVLFAAAAELCATTAALVGRIGSGPPSVGLAMRVCDGLDWQALRPDGALRRARLLALGAPAVRFTERPLWVEETVLQFLSGVIQLAPELTALALPFGSTPAAPLAEPALAEIAAHLAADTSRLAARPVALACDDRSEALAHALEALRRAGCAVLVLPLAQLPQGAGELETVRNLWLRDSLLHHLGLVLVSDGDNARVSAAQLLGWAGPLIIIGCDALPALADAHVVAIRHDRALRLTAWRKVLADEGKRHAAELEQLATRFRLSTPAIASLAAEHGAGETDDLWRAARAAARPRDLDLVERIEAVVTLDQVVLPDDARATVQEMVSAARVHHRILADWGPRSAGARGLGIAALFSGESGTGKTMAAEAIARELRLDLYKVEVSAVVSKYIGETEKNLRRIFAAAEAGGGVLLFDEADAIFGKRSEVHDAHDRYANTEVGYLLQLMESYAGLAILTPNFREALDEAFTRRLRFMIEFPMPGFEERRAIWQGAFPGTLDTAGLDCTRLARLPLSGGAIRNIALGAAFRAAARESGSLTMADALGAARAEYRKLGRPVAEIDAKDWS